MYENEVLENLRSKITTYTWHIENPQNVMCIIHGIGEHIGRYDRMAKVLNEAGIAVIGVDLPGHGLSGGKRGHAAPRSYVLDVVTAMLEFAKKKYPDAKLTLYGHSMGGNICLDYRCRGEKNDLPQRYIVSAPWVKLVKSVPTPLVAVVRALSKLMPQKAISSGCNYKDLGNIDIVKSYDEDPLVHGHITLECAVSGFIIGNELFSGKHKSNGRAENKPFLLMHGSDDKICSVTGSREIAKQNEKNTAFTYIEWDGYYHEIHNGGPNAKGEKVIEAIRDFIKENINEI